MGRRYYSSEGLARKVHWQGDGLTQKKTSKIGTSSAHWFFRGLIGGVMLVAAANAMSYFFRTPGISDLISKDQRLSEAIGFPFEIWREDRIYHESMYLDYWMVCLNLLVGIGIGLVFGVVALALQGHFNRWVAEFESKNATAAPINLQFSVKSLLLMTTLVALFIAAFTSWHGTPQVLLAIYFFGPICLVLVAVLPNRIRMQHRVVLLTLLAFTMIGVAISTGVSLEVPMDRVLLGIFVSWTPQSAFAAFILIIGLIAHALWFGTIPKHEASALEN